VIVAVLLLYGPQLGMNLAQLRLQLSRDFLDRTALFGVPALFLSMAATFFRVAPTLFRVATALGRVATALLARALHMPTCLIALAVRALAAATTIAFSLARPCPTPVTPALADTTQAAVDPFEQLGLLVDHLLEGLKAGLEELDTRPQSRLVTLPPLPILGLSLLGRWEA
jgi:hypothetical protein